MKLKVLILAVAMSMPLGARASGAPVSDLLMIPLMVLGSIAHFIDGLFSSEADDEQEQSDEAPPMPAAGESS